MEVVKRAVPPIKTTAGREARILYSISTIKIR